MAEPTPEIKKKNEQRRMRACKTRLIDKPQRRLHRKPIMKGFVRIKESSSRQREPRCETGCQQNEKEPFIAQARRSSRDRIRYPHCAQKCSTQVRFSAESERCLNSAKPRPVVLHDPKRHGCHCTDEPRSPASSAIATAYMQFQTSALCARSGHRSLLPVAPDCG